MDLSWKIVNYETFTLGELEQAKESKLLERLGLYLDLSAEALMRQKCSSSRRTTRPNAPFTLEALKNFYSSRSEEGRNVVVVRLG